MNRSRRIRIRIRINRVMGIRIARIMESRIRVRIRIKMDMNLRNSRSMNSSNLKGINRDSGSLRQRDDIRL